MGEGAHGEVEELRIITHRRDLPQVIRIIHAHQAGRIRDGRALRVHPRRLDPRAPQVTRQRGGRERFLWLAVAGLLAFVALRLHNLAAIPLFIDEAIAIDRAADVAQGVFLKHASHGKLLLPYYLLPFQPQTNAVFMARASVILAACLGFAAGVAIARRYGGGTAGCLAMIFVAASPMLHFFDRMALTDTLLQAATTIWVWSLLCAFDTERPRYQRVWISAALFAIASLRQGVSSFSAAIAGLGCRPASTLGHRRQNQARAGILWRLPRFVGVFHPAADLAAGRLLRQLQPSRQP